MRTNVLYLAYKSHLWEERLLLFRYMDEISEKRLRKDDVGGEKCACLTETVSNIKRETITNKEKR